MNLLNPWNLLWLAPLVGGIVALWMLRRKRQDVTVPSLYLWRTVLQETTANTPFQKLRRSLLLFLQLLVAFLLVFALARPFVFGRGLAGRTLVVVLDTSASMSATDVRPTRLAAAKEAAKTFLAHEMSGSDVAAVIAAGALPEAKSGFTGNRARLEDAIDQTAGTEAVSDLPAALLLAQSLVAGREGARIEVFSDGVFSPDAQKRLAALSFGGIEVRQELIGTPTPDNVAITALDGRRDPATGRTEVFVAVQSVGRGAHTTGTLSLLQDGKLIDARALALTGGTQSETFDSALLSRGGIITARLDDVKDDLSSDDQAAIVLPPVRPARVLLVSAGSLFLEQGLNVAPNVTVEECTPEQFATVGRRGAGYAVVVFDGVLPSGPLPPGNYLVFGAASRQTPLAPAGAPVTTPRFIDQSRTHPVLRFVDLSGVHVATALRVKVQPWAQTLVDGEGGPWIAAGETGGRRMVSVAFDLSNSDLPLRVSFPIFLSNAVGWLSQGGIPGAAASETPAGRPAPLIVPPGLDSLTIVRPDRTRGAVAAPSQGGTVAVGETDQVGVYHALGTGGIDYPFAVDLLDPTTSALTAQKQAALDHPGAARTMAFVPKTKREHRDLLAAVAAIALVFLVLEWFVYHRRIL